ncbi:hypothetical protein Tco_0226035 [Tanacetum coccineum]
MLEARLEMERHPEDHALDVDGMMSNTNVHDDKEDDGDILNKEIDHSKEVKENSIDLEFSDDGKEKVEGIGMNPKGLVELDGKNIEMDDKCLEVIDSFVNKDDEAEENKGNKKKRMSLVHSQPSRKGDSIKKTISLKLDKMFAAYDAQKNNMSVEGFVGHSMKKNDHEGAWYERITKKRTKNKAKTTKLDSEWKSCEEQGQSKAKDQISQVKVNSTNQQSKTGSRY